MFRALSSESLFPSLWGLGSSDSVYTRFGVWLGFVMFVRFWGLGFGL